MTTSTDADATRDADGWEVASPITTTFDFDYSGGREQLLRLYDKSTRRQWIGSTGRSRSTRSTPS